MTDVTTSAGDVASANQLLKLANVRARLNSYVRNGGKADLPDLGLAPAASTPPTPHASSHKVFTQQHKQLLDGEIADLRHRMELLALERDQAAQRANLGTDFALEMQDACQDFLADAVNRSSFLIERLKCRLQELHNSKLHNGRMHRLTEIAITKEQNQHEERLAMQAQSFSEERAAIETEHRKQLAESNRQQGSLEARIQRLTSEVMRYRTTITLLQEQKAQWEAKEAARAADEKSPRTTKYRQALMVRRTEEERDAAMAMLRGACKEAEGLRERNQALTEQIRELTLQQKRLRVEYASSEADGEGVRSGRGSSPAVLTPAPAASNGSIAVAATSNLWHAEQWSDAPLATSSPGSLTAASVAAMIPLNQFAVSIAATSGASAFDGAANRALAQSNASPPRAEVSPMMLRFSSKAPKTPETSERRSQSPANRAALWSPRQVSQSYLSPTLSSGNRSRSADTGRQDPLDGPSAASTVASRRRGVRDATRGDSPTSLGASVGRPQQSPALPHYQQPLLVAAMTAVSTPKPITAPRWTDRYGTCHSWLFICTSDVLMGWKRRYAVLDEHTGTLYTGEKESQSSSACMFRLTEFPGAGKKAELDGSGVPFFRLCDAQDDNFHGLHHGVPAPSAAYDRFGLFLVLQEVVPAPVIGFRADAAAGGEVQYLAPVVIRICATSKADCVKWRSTLRRFIVTGE